MITKKKSKGKTLVVSELVHEKLSKEAFNSKPRRTLREHMNIINGLSSEK